MMVTEQLKRIEEKARQLQDFNEARLQREMNAGMRIALSQADYALALLLNSLNKIEQDQP